jgi:hypothetical protein
VIEATLLDSFSSIQKTSITGKDPNNPDAPGAGPMQRMSNWVVDS